MASSYRIAIRRSAEKEIDALPLDVRRRVVVALTGLADDPRPRGSIRLSGDDKRRIRIGKYRVVYTLDEAEREVVVVRVAHRSDVYR